MDFSSGNVCRSASCPNLGECFHAGTATFLILGGICTRGCRFTHRRNPNGLARQVSQNLTIGARLCAAAGDNNATVVSEAMLFQYQTARQQAAQYAFHGGASHILHRCGGT